MVRVERAFIIHTKLMMPMKQPKAMGMGKPIRFPSEKIAIKCEKSMERIRLMCGDGLSVVAV